MNPKDEALLKSWNPCTDGLKWGLKCKSLAEVFDTCQRSDWLLWLLRKNGTLGKKQWVELSVLFAERALPKFEREYPKDKRPRKALEAARAWLKNPTEKNRKAAAAADAAAAAYAAADVAAADVAAAYAAAAAAYAADAAAYAAAYAADAAAYAAAYAAAADAAADAAVRAVAAADDEREKQKQDLLDLLEED